MKEKIKKLLLALCVMYAFIYLLVNFYTENKNDNIILANAISQVETTKKPLRTMGCNISWNKYSQVVEVYCIN